MLDDPNLTSDKELWDKVVELGWTSLPVPEEFGGLGLEPLAMCLLSQEIGRSIAPIPFSSTMYFFVTGLLEAGSDEQKSKYFPQIIDGKVGTMAASEPRAAIASNSINTVYSSNDATSGTVTGVKSAVLDGCDANFSIVLCKNGDSNCLTVVDHDETVQVEKQDAVDGSRSYAQLTFNDSPATLLGNLRDGWDIYQSILDKSSVYFAFEQVGGAETAMSEAKNYAMERYAFGRPIASYQAVKHRLADMYIKNQLAISNCYYAAYTLNNDASDLALASATARVGASQAFNFAAQENIQLHGGMGFTWEFDCHLYYRRSKALSLVTGGISEWQDRLTTALQRTNRVN